MVPPARRRLHGVFGLIDVPLDDVRTGRDAHSAAVARIFNYPTEKIHRSERVWPSGLISHEEICGLMLGNAGIGHVYLRLADPSLGSMLAPRPRQAAGRATQPDGDILPVPAFGEADQASNAIRS
jgi:hypothetical protein